MSIAKFLQRLTARQIELSVDGDRLRYHGPREALDEATLAELRARKPDLVKYLRRTAGAKKEVTPPGAHALSFGQEALWFVHQLDRDSLAYNTMVAARLDRSTDLVLLQDALHRLHDRHPVLSSRFMAVDGRPWQRFETDAGATLKTTSAAGLPPSAVEARIAALSDQPFDLETGPLVRWHLLTDAAITQECEPGPVLLFVAHHSVIDFRSLEIVLRDLSSLYRSERDSVPAALPTLPWTYGTYVDWSRAWVASPEGTKARDYWLGVLGGELPVLDIPTDSPRPSRQSFAGSTLTRTLDPDLSRRLVSAARMLGITPFVLMLGAYGLLLHRHSGQEELVIGAPMLGRNRSELTDLVGYLVNPVALRLRFSDGLLGRSFLAQLHRTVLEALEHQDYPFPRLVEDLQPERDPSRSPIFQAAFVYERQRETPNGEFDPIDEVIAGGQRGAVFDITLTVLERDGQIRMTWDYARALFEDTTIDRMASHLERLLASLIDGLEQPVASLPLLSSPELRQLHDWNQTGTDQPVDQTVDDLITRQCSLAPDSIAVDDGTCRLSYATLDAVAGRLARRLKAAGVGPNKVVALLLRRPMDQVIAVLAVLRAGGACMPLEKSDPLERRAHLLSDSAAAAVLTDPDWLPLLPETTAEIITLEPEELTREDGGFPHVVGDDVLSRAKPDDLAYVLFTSGSTGRPKGVAMPHRALVNLAVWQAGQPGLGGPARTLQFTRLTFDVAFQEIVTTWNTGGTLVLIDEALRRDSRALLDWIDAQRVERLFVPFVALQHLAEATRGTGFPASLKEIVTAGEQLRCTPPIKEAFAACDCRLHNHYGPTETHVVTTFRMPRPVSEWEDLPPIGRPIANTAVHVLDRSGELVPVGVPGELCIAGTCLAHGYLNRPDLTAQSFVDHKTLGRIYRTGDIVRRRPDGTLAYVGRRDRQVKIRGIRVEIDEIESVLNAHPAVGEAAVVFRGNSETVSEPRLAAYVSPASDADGSDETLRLTLLGYLRDRLPGAMVPSSLTVLDSLPQTTSGKVDRRALPEPRLAAESDPSLQSSNEALLASIWGDLLGVPDVGINANFFELGGHSLLAMRLVARIRDTFGIDVPVQTVFDQPTVSGLAKRVDSQLGAAPLPPIKPLSQAETPPTSFTQQRLWFMEKLNGPGPTYSMPATFAVNGPIDVEAFRRAATFIVRRHDSMRASFPEVQGAPSLRLIDAYDPLNVTDLGQLDPAEREAEAERLSQSHALHPFDLAEGPLFRLHLLRFDEQTHWLLFNMHHIISDGWSLGVLVRELSSLYRTFSNHAAADLPPLQVQYQDFAAWQRNWFQGPTLERQLAHWRRRLAGVPTVLELPGDRSRPPKPSFRGGYVEHRLDASLSSDLGRFARAEGCTDFMVLLAAFGLLLARYSGQRDLLIGTPVANRRHSDCEDLIGYFANTLALRCRIDASVDFATLIKAVRRDCIDAYANQDIPFELLVRDLHVERNLTHTPLIQVMLVMQDNIVEEMVLDGAEVTLLASPVTAAKFDLTVYLEASGTELISRWEYNADIFDAERIAHMAEHFEQVLRGALTAPRQPLASLDMTTADERDLISQLGTGPHHPLPWHHLLDGFAAQVARTPTAPAVVAGNTHLTYDQLNAQANRLARVLIRRGIKTGDRVALCFDQDPDLVVALLAIVKTGATYIPLASSYPVNRLAFMLNDAEVTLVLTKTALTHRLPAGPFPLFLLDAEAEAISAEDPTDTEVRSSPDDALYVIYTSGSTGRPKGALVGHRGFANLLHWYCRTLALTETDRCLLVSAIGFDLTQKNVFAPLMTGAALHLIDNEIYDPGVLRSTIDQREITWINCTPSAFYPLLGDGSAGELAALSSLRWVVLGGEPIQVDRLKHWLTAPSCNARVINSYGPTECTDVSVAGLLDPEAGDQDVPLGTPIDNVRLQVLDDNNLPTPVGQQGELFIGGICVGKGYVGRPDLTDERFVERFVEGRNQRFYATGDLVYWRSDGALGYLGRKDAQVKLRGHRIELEEIEAAIRALPDVTEAAVAAVDDSDAERLSAYFVSSKELDGVSLRTALEASLPRYMVPDTFVRLERLPLSPNGKLNRDALPKVVRHGSHVANPPQGPTEKLLASLWLGLLNLDMIDRDANFFEVGGHSLLAVALTARIKEAFAVELSLESLFRQPTIIGLARLIEERRGREFTPLVALPQTSEPELSLAQQRLLFGLERNQERASAHVAWARLVLRGELDKTALRQALRGLVERHDSLRLHFRDADGVLQPHWASPFDPLTEVNLSGLPEAEATSEAQRLCHMKVESLSNLVSGPLFKLTLLTLGPTSFELLFAMHHIVGDGQSIDVLIADLESLYEAACRGAKCNLPKIAMQYADFAAWQWDRFNRGSLGPQLDFWRSQLEGAPELLALPLDRVRPAVQAHDGRSVPVQIDAELSEALRTLARRHECGVFVVLLAAYQLLLSRYSGERDLSVGVPVAHRNDCQLQTMVGLFMNTLVMRSQIPETESFAGFLSGLRQRVLSAFANQDIPYDYLVEELRPVPSRSFNPLFQVMMNLNGPHQSKLKLEGVDVEVLSRGSDFLQAYDLNLNLTDWPDGGLGGELHYDATLFEKGTADFLARGFTAMLREVATNPDAPMSELPLAGTAEPSVDTLPLRPASSNAPVRFGAIERSIADRFAEQVIRSPDAIAVCTPDEALSYRELDVAARRVAAAILERPGSPRVGLLLPHDPRMAVGMCGTLQAGRIYVPLDPGLSDEKLRSILEEGGVSLILCTSVLEDRARAVAGTDEDIINLDRLDQPPRPVEELPSISPDHLACLHFPSGDDGRSRTVMQNHRSVLHFVRVLTERLQLSPADRLINLVPCAVDAGVMDILAALLNGATACMYDLQSRTVANCAAWLDKAAITVWHSTPSIYRGMLADLDKSLPDVRLVFLSGERVVEADFAAYRRAFETHCRFANGYGVPEAPVATLFIADHLEKLPGSAVPIGFPADGIEIDLLDEIGSVNEFWGEIVIKSASLAQSHREYASTGLTDDPERLGRSRFPTGDLARRLPDGSLVLIGRCDSQIRRNGARIDVADIEQTLLTHPGVHQVAVICCQSRDPQEGPENNTSGLIAYVYGEASTEDIQKHCVKNLAEYLVPQRIIAATAATFTPSGKLKLLLTRGSA